MNKQKWRSLVVLAQKIKEEKRSDPYDWSEIPYELASRILELDNELRHETKAATAEIVARLWEMLRELEEIHGERFYHIKVRLTNRFPEAGKDTP